MPLTGIDALTSLAVDFLEGEAGEDGLQRDAKKSKTHLGCGEPNTFIFLVQVRPGTPFAVVQ